MKNSLINQSFKNAKKENRPALLTYTVAGDNTKKNPWKFLNQYQNMPIYVNWDFHTTLLLQMEDKFRLVHIVQLKMVLKLMMFFQ